jgi:hypothetical protein
MAKDVYFIELIQAGMESGKYLKIGSTTNILSRIKSLSALFQSKYKLRVLAFTDSFTELEIHEKFQRYHEIDCDSNEIYLFSDEIKEFISKLPKLNEKIEYIPIGISSIEDNLLLKKENGDIKSIYNQNPNCIYLNKKYYVIYECYDRFWENWWMGPYDTIDEAKEDIKITHIKWSKTRCFQIISSEILHEEMME